MLKLDKGDRDFVLDVLRAGAGDNLKREVLEMFLCAQPNAVEVHASLDGRAIKPSAALVEMATAAASQLVDENLAGDQTNVLKRKDLDFDDLEMKLFEQQVANLSRERQGIRPPEYDEVPVEKVGERVVRPDLDPAADMSRVPGAVKITSFVPAKGRAEAAVPTREDANGKRVFVTEEGEVTEICSGEVEFQGKRYVTIVRAEHISNRNQVSLYALIKRRSWYARMFPVISKRARWYFKDDVMAVQLEG